MRLKLVIHIFLLFSSAGKAGEIRFPVSEITPSLLKGANVVKRMEHQEFQVKNMGETILRRRFALTIMNEAGDEHAALVEYYDKWQQVKSIEGSLYDANGSLVKKLKQKEILDLGASDENNLADDNRKKLHRFFHRSYPYTIYYEVETHFSNTLFFPSWMPQEDECFAVEQSSYIVKTSDDYTLRYRAFNYNGEPIVNSAKGMKTMTWQVKDLVAADISFASPSWNRLTTSVIFAPAVFEIDQYRGDMSSWKDFGRFIHSLKKDGDQLPANIEQHVRELIAGSRTDKEKIEILYKYLQQHTRYISIQLGLGGWQPAKASFVAEKGYGDCKALTNYMSALLKAAGIKSYDALVRAGAGLQAIVEDFPSQQFNHVILCVPLESDTVWLECTSQVLPAGYLGDFTSNRKALLISDNGGVLVSTPIYGLTENIQERKIKAVVDREGQLTMKVNTNYDALKGDRLRMMMNSLSTEKIHNLIANGLELPPYDLRSFHYVEERNMHPRIREELELVIPAYAIVSGKRIFIQPNILNRSNDKAENELLNNPEFVFDISYRDEDSCEIEIPSGYDIESMPPDVNVKNSFGSYQSTTSTEGNKIVYHRVREQYAGTYPSAEREKLIHFLEAIYKSDRAKLVLIRKE